MSTLPRLPVLVSVLVLAAGGCSSATEAELVIDELERAEALWLEKRPVSYTALERRSCFCTPASTRPIVIEVTRRQGATVPSGTEAITAATYFDDGEPVPDEVRQLLRPADALFDEIREAAEAGAHAIEAVYDPELGYPRSVFIDREAGIADDEIGWSFELLVPPGT